ncbi:hypothetical protein ABB37_02915 [Leptomonas pyrrhocoris]|uniref:ZN622/Rei1/Reh1 zinc finger C2H2-type domain-containing protein n=1 Tax=Leptomonas pyrrhocoris TaxID=157538 RepID=A0A0N0DXP8_LEPPY|nr:hypothetical protein ABB37_02915 [Leptomonas pyrrhocoris]KPA83235.1 hypothetical protein ABB37_02915 [Leptomonas pyrrhocoris]|eukprot:XP_015661674.1 hypothetical protein ABB37_02915 [Leptomonas pyrrhocoris]
MSSDLKDSCKQILHRLQQQDVAEFACVLCAQHVRGQDALMQHLIGEHHIHCVHFDNVSNLPELLRHLSLLLHRGSAPSHWTCPVCGEDTHSADVDVLLQHAWQKNHASWNPSTVPSLSEWWVTVTMEKTVPTALKPVRSSTAAAGNTNGVADDQEDDDDTAWDAMEDEEVDEDEDWNLDCVCLYCDYDGEDVLEHLKSTHDFDFRTAVQQRDDMKNEYDLIRIVNAVRRAVAADRCPFDEHCAIDGTHNDRAALEQHLRMTKAHRLPAHVAENDAALIPVLPGDAFISMLVTSGGGFLKAEEDDPDFPMVPTVHELAAAARERGSKR